MRADDISVSATRCSADHRPTSRGVGRAPLNGQARWVAASGMRGEADMTGCRVVGHHCLCEEGSGLSITFTISKDQACAKRS